MRDFGLSIRSIVIRMLAIGVVAFAAIELSSYLIDSDWARSLILVVTNGLCFAAGWVLIIEPFRRYVGMERFASELNRGLEMVTTREDWIEVIRRGIRSAAPGLAAQGLVADSSHAHFMHVNLLCEGRPEAQCPAEGPQECIVVRTGQMRQFLGHDRIDSCPRLAGRACSATCLPVHILGRTTGVMHVTGPENRLPSSASLARLVTIAEQLGDRIGRQNAMARSEIQASTDSLTGLLNRRTLENRVRELAEQRVPYTVAMLDLDHFKTINDTFGHEKGDRAIRTFGRVLKDAVRDADIVARLGGDEFVVVFPHCDQASAAEVLDRFRADLGDALRHVDVPPFTCSSGIADSHYSSDLDDVLRVADRALMASKANGRNRLSLSGAEAVVPDAEVSLAAGAAYASRSA